MNDPSTIAAARAAYNVVVALAEQVVPAHILEQGSESFQKFLENALAMFDMPITPQVLAGFVAGLGYYASHDSGELATRMLAVAQVYARNSGLRTLAGPAEASYDQVALSDQETATFEALSALQGFEAPQEGH